MVLVLCLLLLFGAYTFFILAESHNVSKTKSIHIDHFLDDTYSFHADIGTLVFLFYVPSSPSTTTFRSCFLFFFCIRLILGIWYFN